MYDFERKTQVVPNLRFDNALGTEIMIEFSNCLCTSDKFADTVLLASVFNSFITASNFTLVNEFYHASDLNHASATIALEEGSVTCHTHGENKYVSINVFYQSQAETIADGIELLNNYFSPTAIEIISFDRG